MSTQVKAKLKPTKLVATIGPSSDNYATLKKMILNGVTCIRANFSHGSYEEHTKKYDLARQISSELQIPISLMLDTKGPEIRIGKMTDGAQVIKANTKITIYCEKSKYDKFLGTSTELTVPYDMSKDLKKGDQVLIDDGKLITNVIDVQPKKVIVKAVNTHKVKTNKRINLPGVEFSLPFLSKKDKEDVLYGIKIGVDYIAASFVNSASDVKELRKILDNNGGSHIQIISKIESELGVKNMEEIIDESDGIMIARGDLGLEVPYYEVPIYQNDLIQLCNSVGKPVIVATQMLDSMENSPSPTRAEVTDVYEAIYKGADSTMLSGESANGTYPVEAVKTMATIASSAFEQSEKNSTYADRLCDVALENIYNGSSDVSDAAYNATYRTLTDDIKLIVPICEDEFLLHELYFSKAKHGILIAPIFKDENLVNKYGIYRSVWPVYQSKLAYEDYKKDSNSIINYLNNYSLKKGDKIMVVTEYETEIIVIR